MARGGAEDEHPAPGLAPGRRWKHAEVWIPLIYVLASGAWIALSDRFIAVRSASQAEQTLWSTAKGLGFVLTTATLLFLGIRRALRLERRAEQALRESEVRFQAIFEQAAVGVVQVETATGRIQQVNARFCEMLGYAPGELVGRSWEILTHPEDLERDRAGVRRMVDAGVPYRTEKRYLRKDGSELWASLTVNLIAAPGEPARSQVAVVEDITDRRRAAEALAKSEERFRTLIERSSDLLLVLDGEGRHAYWSQGATEALGWRPEEVLGRPVIELLHPDDRERLARSMAVVMSRPGEVSLDAGRFRHRDGSWRQLEVTARNLLEDPAVQGLVVNARDVTTQRLLEAQLRQAQKLEGVGRLAGGVAHDFNNLLTVILGCSASLEEALAEGRPLEPADVRDIRAAGARASELTRQLLAFARKQVIVPVPLDLGRLVHGSEKLLRRVLGEDVELVVAVRAEGWRVRCDPGQLEQVILNLAVNARDAMPRGGVLRIDVDPIPAGGAPGPEAGAGEHVRLAVRDTGVGMSEEVKAHLFEPFFTTKPVGQGTGLGLATTYGIVRQSGGVIRVESAPGRGTAVEVYLPRTLDPAPAEVGAAAAGAGGTEPILLVEDDEQVREVTLRALRRGGYDVRVASRPQQALELAPAELGRMRLLITDVVMPGQDGRALADELRRRHPGLRVLYVSGYTRDAIAERGVVDAGMGFLQKPFTGPVLLERVRAILDAR